MSRTTTGRPQTAGGLSRAARLYILLIAGLALVVGWFCWGVAPLSRQDLPGLVVLCALRFVGVGVTRQRLTDKYSLNVSLIVLVASVAIVGPFGATIVGFARSFARRPGRRRMSYSNLFNSAMGAFIAGVAGLVYLGVGGMSLVRQTGSDPVPFPIPGSLDTPHQIVLHIGLPLLLSDVVMLLLNTLVLSVILDLTDETATWRHTLIPQLTTFGLPYVGYGIIGFLFVILWWPAQLGIFSAVLILPPLFVANYAFAQYADERSAHERTLSALVTAVEVKDVYTRGHSERVARLCELMAEPLGLSAGQREALRYAGLLHDIGKLGIPTKVLRKTDRMTDEDMAAVIEHPARGVDMLGDIEFLRDSHGGILHHHERWDGRGYPSGLSGDQIPLFARVIAVADAFDSLTTIRADRDALPVDRALVELHRRSGSHLDGVVVVALERALARHSWGPTRLDEDTLALSGRAFDHDDPFTSDLMATRAAELRSGGSRRVRSRAAR